MTDGQSDADYGKQSAQAPPVANKLNAEAIGRSVADRACPTGSCAWTHTVANIVAEEVTKAMGKADEAKDDTGAFAITNLNSTIGCRDELIEQLRQDIHAKGDLIRRLRRDIEDRIAPLSKADLFPGDTWSKGGRKDRHDAIVAHLQPCGSSTIRDLSRALGFAPDEVRLLAATSDDLVWFHVIDGRESVRLFTDKGVEVKEAKEPSNPPAEPLNETDEDAMVCAISIYFLDHTEATIMQLAELAEVPEKQIRRYVKSASHLIYSMQVVVRLLAAAEKSQTPTGE